MQPIVRHAHTGDVVAMQQLINGFASKDEMLSRSLSQLYENLRDFFVVEYDDEICGCAALHVTWKDLAEVKSLAVSQSAQGKGYGRMLVQRCLQEAKVVRVDKVFALTYKPEFFVKLGFRICDRAELPRKVWTECVHCPKFYDCHEIAVITEVAP